jgi:hypothetical protein
MEFIPDLYSEQPVEGSRISEYNQSQFESTTRVFEQAGVSNPFSPELVIDALMVLSPTEASEFFAGQDMAVLARRIRTFQYLTKSPVPLHDLDDWPDLCLSAILHLKKNRERLVESGYPDASFAKSDWLNRRLMRALPTKLPIATQAKQSPRQQWESEQSIRRQSGRQDLLYEFSWCGEDVLESTPRLRLYLDEQYIVGPGVGWNSTDEIELPTGTVAQFCEYSEAPSLACFEDADEDRLGRFRDKIVEIKISVLRHISRCFEGSGAILDIEQCLDEICNVVSQEDLEYIQASEERFLHYYVENSLHAASSLPEIELTKNPGLRFYEETQSRDARRIWEHLPTMGGIIDLYGLIGHFVVEPTAQVFHTTSELLKKLGIAEGACYYSLVGDPKREHLDGILDEFFDLHSEMEERWTRYRMRFNDYFSRKHRRPVSIAGDTFMIPYAHKDAFVERILSVGKIEETSINNSGELTPSLYRFRDRDESAAPDPEPREPDGIIQASFQQMGDHWKFEFKGKSVHIKHLKGCHVLNRLLHSPGETFNALTLYHLGNADKLDDSTMDLTANQAVGEGLSIDSGATIHDKLSENKTLQNLNEAIRKKEEMIELKKDESLDTSDDEHELELLIERRKSDFFHGEFVADSQKTPVKAPRSNVSKAISRVVDRLKDCHPDLYEHLNNKSILHTGISFWYHPHEDDPVVWG